MYGSRLIQGSNKGHAYHQSRKFNILSVNVNQVILLQVGSHRTSQVSRMEQLTAGFETERFVNQPIREAFCCSICFGVLRDAVQCPSEHAFCRTCISIWLSGSNTCPMDRTELSSSQLVQLPRAIRGMIDELEIKCEFANYGCNQTSLLQNYAKFDIHISACLYRSIKQDKERIASLETGMKTIAALVADDVIVVEMSVDELTNLIITKIGEKDFELTELKSVEAEEARMMMGAIISEQSSSKESLENQLALLRVENLENQEEIRQLREYKQKFEDKEREFDEFRQNLERTIRNPTSPRASAPPVSSFDPGSRLVSPSAMQARVFGDLTDSFPISSKVLEALKRVDFGEFNSDLGRNESR